MGLTPRAATEWPLALLRLGHPGHRAGSALPDRAARRLHHPDWPYLDCAVTRTRAAPRPGQSGIEIGHLDQVIAAELLLGLGERTVEHVGLAIFDADRGRGRRRPEPIGGHQYLGVLQGLGVGYISVDRLGHLLARHA